MFSCSWRMPLTSFLLKCGWDKCKVYFHRYDPVLGRFFSWIPFFNLWTTSYAVWMVPKTNHCQHVTTCTNIVITSVSVEYLWPTTLKELNLSYRSLLFCLVGISFPWWAYNAIAVVSFQSFIQFASSPQPNEFQLSLIKLHH